jgi:hypothetical protein
MLTHRRCSAKEARELAEGQTWPIEPNVSERPGDLAEVQKGVHHRELLSQQPTKPNTHKA